MTVACCSPPASKTHKAYVAMVACATELRTDWSGPCLTQARTPALKRQQMMCEACTSRTAHEAMKPCSSLSVVAQHR